MRRMPPLPQRRNAAYLNRLCNGSRGAGCRTNEPIVAYLDEPPRLVAPRDRRAKNEQLFILDLCVLTVELSGAHADV